MILTKYECKCTCDLVQFERNDVRNFYEATLSEWYYLSMPYKYTCNLELFEEKKKDIRTCNIKLENKLLPSHVR